MLLGSFPATLYVLYFNIAFMPPSSRYSWKVVHGPHWGEVVKVPSYGHVMYDRWIHVTCAFFLLIFFGFGQDAMQMYRSWFSKCGELGGLLSTRFSSFGSRAKTALSKSSSITESSDDSWYENTPLFLPLQDILPAVSDKTFPSGHESKPAPTDTAPVGLENCFLDFHPLATTDTALVNLEKRLSNLGHQAC
jgi:hypothetical protein